MLINLHLKKNHSTQLSLHRVLDDFHEAFNDHDIISSCFLDISKCFDTIDHDLLLFKLSKYGVSCNEHKWFTNYLSNRKQVVSCHGELSKPNYITVEVPQGSVLGLLLFILFINDITQSVNLSTCIIFADDVVILYDRE